MKSAYGFLMLVFNASVQRSSKQIGVSMAARLSLRDLELKLDDQQLLISIAFCVDVVIPDAKVFLCSEEDYQDVVNAPPVEKKTDSLTSILASP